MILSVSKNNFDRTPISGFGGKSIFAPGNLSGCRCIETVHRQHLDLRLDPDHPIQGIICFDRYYFLP